MAGGFSDPGMMAAAEAELNQLEEIVLSKVQQRVPSRMSEETYLVKSFRHFDLSSAGWCDFDKFKRTLLPFTAGIGDRDLRFIFDRYATEGALAYKQFAAEFVSGSRRQQGAEAPFEAEEAGDSPEETLQRLKAFVYSLGPRGITSLALACRDADEQNSRGLPFDAFREVLFDFLREMECPLQDESVDALLELLRQPYQPDVVAYDQFFLALKQELSDERRASIRAAFRRLDTNSQGLVELNRILQCFNTTRHPQVADGTREPEEVLSEFAETLKDLVAFRRGKRSYPSDMVAWEEFEDYYKFVSGCFESDVHFCSTLQKVWDLDKAPNASAEKCSDLARPAAGIPGKARAGLHHWQQNTLPSSITHHDVARVANAPDVLLRTRQRIATKGLRAAIDVVKNLYAADDDVDDQLDVYEFRKACQHSGLTFREAEEVAIFEACGAGVPGRRNAKIQVPVFLQLLHGALSPARRQAVEAAFASVGGDPYDEGSTVSPAVLKERFVGEAHPLVQRGELDPGAPLREFLDTFSLLAHVRGGCENGLVRFSDFLAYYEVVSSTVDNDAFFDLMVRRVWSLPAAGGQGAGGDSPRRLRDLPGLSPRRESDSPSPMARRRPPAHEGPSTYARPVSQEEPVVRAEDHRRYQRKEAWQDNSVATAAVAAATAATGFSPITKSSIVFNDFIPAEMRGVAVRVREAVGRRGLRGWRTLATKLEQGDVRRNGTIMRLDWARVLKTSGLGVSPEEAESFFKALSAGRRDAAMDIRECLQLLRGDLPEWRQALVARLWEVLCQEGGGAVAAEALKAAFDARNTPPCLLGRQSAPEAVRDFAEAVDYFVGGGAVDPQRFKELFLMVSASHQDDDEFRLMTTAAFGLPGGPGSLGGS